MTTLRVLIVVAIWTLFIPAGCGDRTAPESPTVIQEKTTTDGFLYGAVSAGSPVEYTAYCSQIPVFTPAQAIIVKSLGDAPSGRWAQMEFPSDGNWYCGITARTSLSDESDISRILGIRKEGNIYFRL